MFYTPQSVQAETTYRQERIKRDFRRTRRERPAQAAKPEPRHARHALRTTTAG
ncbi:hypothetical protein AB0P21_16455 [Kribbella sp. NPDC056861]|uniref:hypothetical protein n=1 Tax=Kribbella sp. NPDC056861 TaxID=3154857 RepID=UPI003420F7D9